MDEFIKSVTGRLGMDEGTAKTAIGSILGLLKKEGDNEAVGTLIAKLPGAEALMRSASAPAETGKGGLLGKIGGMVGGLGGGASGLAALASSGLSGDKIKSFVTMFVDWAKGKVGADVVNKAIGSVPALKSLVG